MASVGHIRDLPRKGLAIDVDNHFQPEYVDLAGEVEGRQRACRKALKDADELYPRDRRGSRGRGDRAGTSSRC